MRDVRLTPLGSRITTVSLAIGAGTSIMIYVWVVLIDGHGEAAHPILVGGLIALLLALAIGFYFAQIVAQRVKRIEEAARKVADGDFATRIPVDSSGQLGQLARTFNEMQRRLAELDSARKLFIANASHELRTPIFSLGGFVELLEEEDPSPEEREEFVRTMRQQVERLTKLTADLLNLSQLDAGGVVIASTGVDRRAADQTGDRDDRDQRREDREHAVVGQRRRPIGQVVLPELLRRALQRATQQGGAHPASTTSTVPFISGWIEQM